VQYRLLTAFRGLFAGVKYEHRKSTLGDYVASFLYEDLVDLGHSQRLLDRVNSGRAALNTANKTVGKSARRGDGTFGEVVPGVATVVVPDFTVPRARIASLEIGTETKILAKAMIKQIDRVINDLRAQSEEFKKCNPRAICVALIGVNGSDYYESYEGTRSFRTDGKVQKHPAQESSQARQRLLANVQDSYDELLILPFSARNVPPYDFAWENESELKVQYAAALSRISREYDSRF